MKRKYLIISLFIIITLLVPCSSAFKIPLSDSDKVELKKLINNENDNNQEILNDIIGYNETTLNSTLDLDKVERIYENYILTCDDSVINSDSWSWVVNRLGWVYITIKQVTTLYKSGIVLFNQILRGSKAVHSFFENISDFRAAWQVFITNPLNFLKITILIVSTIKLLMATLVLLEYATSNTIKETIIAFTAQVQVFRDFLESNPWFQPIIIKGNVTGFDDSVKISVKSDSVITTGYYELDYTTNDTSIPWFVHKCIITSAYNDKIITKNRYAFSMGVIEEEFIPSYFDKKSKQIEKPIFLKLSYFLKKFSNRKFYILDDIIKTQIF